MVCDGTYSRHVHFVLETNGGMLAHMVALWLNNVCENGRE